MPARKSEPTEFDAVIVGAGVGGLYAIYRLRKLGLKVRAYEAGSGVGGTWFWNRYPGCRCDIESLEYSYSFSDELQQQWQWPERYGTQPEILRYLNHVADRFDLRRDVQLGTRITSADFNGKTNLWTLKTHDGDTATAPFCIMATGNLSTPRTPDIPGLSSFKGKWYHTGLWPHAGVDFTGQRVGVIGTGSSGVQMIPHIARQAKHLYVFQRTANFSLPARNAPLDPERERKHKAEYPERRRAAYDTPFGIAGYPPPLKSALEATREELTRTYAAKWEEGGSISFLYAFSDLLVNKASNDTASEFVRDRIRATVKDPHTAELLCPSDHPMGTKRLILDTDYYETYNRDNVTLVDIKGAPIKQITSNGLSTPNAEYALDAIAFATGFDAMTGAMKEIAIRTDTGMTIKQKWANGPRTYLGIMMAGLPNLFMITGPQSPGVKSQMILSCEQHVNWIADCLTYLRDRGYRRIEPEGAAEDAWVEHTNEVASGTLYPLANSWYVGANIPGKPRVFMPYVGGFAGYKRKCDAVAASDYDGFVLSR
jgi:cyclohexanone monooxygenase